ncbi:MAG: hypothetical protein AAFQ22_09360 [Pseudomonadota bacterium]
MSEVVSRLFGDVPHAASSDGGVTSADEFPVEQIKAVVSSIVASSRPIARTPEPVQINEIDSPTERHEVSSEAAKPPMVAEKPTGEVPSQLLLIAEPEDRPEKVAVPRQRRLAKAVMALAALAGLSLSALAAFLGFQDGAAVDDRQDGPLLAGVAPAKPGRLGPQQETSAQLSTTAPEAAPTTGASTEDRPPRTAQQTSETLIVAEPGLPEGLNSTPPTGAAVENVDVVPQRDPPSLAPPSLKTTPPAPREADIVRFARQAAEPSPSSEVQLASLPQPMRDITPGPILPERQQLPLHSHTGPVLAGSAAAIVLELIETSGETLDRDAANEIASRIERALSAELDGRSAHLKTPEGQIAKVDFVSSRLARQTVSVPRANTVALSDTNFAIEGGWFAAPDALSVRPLPDLQTNMEAGQADAGSLFQRIATVTSAYGDRWYLVGQAGVAHGYVSAGDVVPAETFNGPLGRVHGGPVWQPVVETVDATTTCRTFTVFLGADLSRQGDVCRHSAGGWFAQALPEAQGPASTRITEATSLEPILARLDVAADPIERNQLADQLEGLVEQGAQSAELEIPTQSGTLSVGFGERLERRRTINIRRAAEVAPIQDDLTVGHGWVEVIRDTELRPLASERTRLQNGDLARGTRLEIMGIIGPVETARWALLGRGGVAQGYAELSSLRWIDAQSDLKYTAMTRSHGRVIQDVVVAQTVCQTVAIAGSTLEQCARTDGAWGISREMASDAQAPIRVAFVP